MRYILISLILLFSFAGCQEKEQQSSKAQTKHDTKTAEETRAEVLAEFEAEKKAQLAQVKATEAKIKALKISPTSESQKEKDKLSQVGVTMDNDVLTIDTNKTKTFLKDLSKKMEKQMKKISHDLDKGIIEAKEAGVDINNGQINIDLNKTRDLFESWSKKIQVFANEFDEVAKSLDENNTDKGK